MSDSISVVNKPKQWVTALRQSWTEVVAEMKKVTWPNWNEVTTTTIVVLIATIIFAVYLWGCDIVFYQAINFLFGKFGASVSS